MSDQIPKSQPRHPMILEFTKLGFWNCLFCLKYQVIEHLEIYFYLFFHPEQNALISSSNYY